MVLGEWFNILDPVFAKSIDETVFMDTYTRADLMLLHVHVILRTKIEDICGHPADPMRINLCQIRVFEK